MDGWMDAIVDATRPRLDRNGTAPGRRAKGSFFSPAFLPRDALAWSRLAGRHLRQAASRARPGSPCAPLSMVTGGPTEIAFLIAVRHCYLWR